MLILSYFTSLLNFVSKVIDQKKRKKIMVSTMCTLFIASVDHTKSPLTQIQNLLKKLKNKRKRCIQYVSNLPQTPPSPTTPLPLTLLSMSPAPQWGRKFLIILAKHEDGLIQIPCQKKIKWSKWSAPIIFKGFYEDGITCPICKISICFCDVPTRLMQFSNI